MNRIEQLIEELCPDGVEWKMLGKCLERTKGTPITAQQMSEINKEGAPIKIFAGGKTVAYVDYGNIPEKDILTKKSIVVKSRGIIEFEYIDKPFSHKNEFWSYHSNSLNINIKYVFYYLKSKEAYFQSVGQRMSKMPQLSIPDTDKFPIPLPPLPIQQEIVTILDAFTALDASLQAELEARRKQYEHYRNQLLNFEGKEVEWKTLGEIANFSNGKGHEKEIVEKGKYIVVNSKFVSTAGKVVKYANNQICPLFKDDILIVMSDLPNGKALAKCFYVTKDNTYTLNQRIGRLSAKNKSEISPKYLFYILNRNQQLLKYDNGTDQTNLRKDDILDIQLPIPPLSEQERIVGILDKFDALVNTELPAEIAARRKQYEYYRGKLLDFKSISNG